jgi:hypothetical protein
MYLGGPRSPGRHGLVNMPTWLHKQYHKGLDKVFGRALDRRKSAEYFRYLSPQQQAEHFQMFMKYTQAFDKVHKTKLWDAVVKVASY